MNKIYFKRLFFYFDYKSFEYKKKSFRNFNWFQLEIDHWETFKYFVEYKSLGNISKAALIRATRFVFET